MGEGNGTPLQYSCRENPMDGGAWWAAVYGVAQSRTKSDMTEQLHFHFLYLFPIFFPMRYFPPNQKKKKRQRQKKDITEKGDVRGK